MNADLPFHTMASTDDERDKSLQGAPSSRAQSLLNPNSASFSAAEWAEAVVETVSRAGGSFRSSGICFQALSVKGLGTGSDFQLDIGNAWLFLARTLAGYMSGPRQRVTILDQFDGLVRTGEMLMVLGPPGSGCSTLLKTLAGETDGLCVGEGSYFNYQGQLVPTGSRCGVSLSFSVLFLLNTNSLNMANAGGTQTRL